MPIKIKKTPVRNPLSKAHRSQGRPKKGEGPVIDEEQVIRFSFYPITQEVMADFCKVSPSTFSKWLKDHEDARMAVNHTKAARLYSAYGKLYQKGVIDGDTACLLFFLKTHGIDEHAAERVVKEQEHVLFVDPSWVRVPCDYGQELPQNTDIT